GEQRVERRAVAGGENLADELLSLLAVDAEHVHVGAGVDRAFDSLADLDGLGLLEAVVRLLLGDQRLTVHDQGVQRRLTGRRDYADGDGRSGEVGGERRLDLELRVAVARQIVFLLVGQRRLALAQNPGRAFRV